MTASRARRSAWGRLRCAMIAAMTIPREVSASHILEIVLAGGTSSVVVGHAGNPLPISDLLALPWKLVLAREEHAQRNAGDFTDFPGDAKRLHPSPDDRGDRARRDRLAVTALEATSDGGLGTTHF